LTHTPWQSLSPLGQTHCRFTQPLPPVQATPQAPQFAGSLFRFTSQPFPAAWSQSPKPARQV
jgi:hypothetical protein